jgi:thiol-disulfide isomerase/thioredoxin
VGGCAIFYIQDTDQMTDIAFGPFSFPIPLLGFVAAVMLAFAVGNRLARRANTAVEPQLWLIVGLMVFAARAAFVLRYLEFYIGQPLRMIDLRDGGLMPGAGAAAGLAAAAWIAWRDQARRTALLAALAAGGAAWIVAASLPLLWGKPQGLPPLSLATLDGHELPLASLAGRPVVLNLWASWCPPCRREMPALAAAQAAQTGVAFVFANQGEPAASVSAYLAAQGLSLRNVVLDSDSRLGRATGSRGLPTTLFFDRRGELVERRVGELSAATLAQHLEALGQQPAAGK